MVTISNDVSYLWQMVLTRAAKDAMFDIPKGSAGRGHGRGQVPHANPPPPPPWAPISTEDLLAT
jgi:hypothetical protein